VLRKAFDLMVERVDELALIMTLENGKTLADAKAEVLYAAEFFRWFSEEAVRVGGELRMAPSGANRILTYHDPIGVAFLITPWNFPAAMATRKLGAALAAGCAAILKPASETPLTSLVLGKILLEAGLPAGVVSVLPTTDSATITKAALADRRVRKLSFTGSTEVGRMLLRIGADRILNSSMELGGNAPFIVLDDADVEAAVAGAMLAKMRNGGQACTAANRFFVQAGVHDEFVARLAEAMGALNPGHGAAPTTTLPPLVNRKAVGSVAELVQDAVARGANMQLGGEGSGGPGCFYPATVLGNVSLDARALQEEVFGPVAPVVKIQTDEDAVDLANTSEFGLASYVYTRDVARGLNVAEGLQAGMVGVNRGLISDPAAPFGGVKQSGLGREGGFEGIYEYLETKYVGLNW
jgi:succinate-semialdehyde dehydrogenase/glutarate-semialdehyde dehydrogenase